MPRAGGGHRPAACVGIAIDAAVAAGVVGTDVHAVHTAAVRPLAVVRLRLNGTAADPFHPLPADAAGGADAEGAPVHFFTAGPHVQARLPADGADRIRQRRHVVRLGRADAAAAYRRAHLGVNVQKADGALLRISRQVPAQAGERVQNTRYIPIRVQQDGIEPPQHPVRPQPIRQAAKGVRDSYLVRQAGLQLRAIGSQSKLKIVGDPPGIQFRQARQEGGRILGPKDDAVHVLRRQVNPADLPGIAGVAHQQEPGPQPVHQPIPIKRRDIRPATGAEYHRTASLVMNRWIYNAAPRFSRTAGTGPETAEHRKERTSTAGCSTGRGERAADNTETVPGE